MKELQNSVQTIISDNKSGSTTILNNTIIAVKEFLERNRDNDKSVLFDELNKLLDYHTNFIVLYHFINALKKYYKQNGGSALLLFIDDYKQKWNNSIKKACEFFINDNDLQGKTILVHSNSSAIRKLFSELKLKKINVSVYQTFSSPAGEGKEQAGYISSLGFDTTFIHEDAAGKFIKEIDMAVFGADLITEDRFLNKVGTLPICLLFRHFAKQVFVIADSRKILRPQELPEETANGMINEVEKPAGELWKNPPENIRAVNYYFEMTENKLVTAFYFETGKGEVKPFAQ